MEVLRSLLAIITAAPPMSSPALEQENNLIKCLSKSILYPGRFPRLHLLLGQVTELGSLLQGRARDCQCRNGRCWELHLERFRQNYAQRLSRLLPTEPTAAGDSRGWLSFPDVIETIERVLETGRNVIVVLGRDKDEGVKGSDMGGPLTGVLMLIVLSWVLGWQLDRDRRLVKEGEGLVCNIQDP